MACQEQLYLWIKTVQQRFPHVSKAEATVLALWSFGMVLVRSCALSAVSGFLAKFQHRQEGTVRQQLREFCYAAKDKRGKQRRELDVTTCFVPLLAWALSGYQGQQLALALDATSLGDRFVVLVISVVYRGCAIPVAWHILAANQREAWRPHWLRLLRLLRPAIPPTMTVLVLADRGLYARWLYSRIRRLGWHPFLRVNAQGTFRPAAAHASRRLSTFVPRPGTSWSGTGIAFGDPQRRLSCTLLAYWADGCDDPWLILTDLPPTAAEASWYGMRAWIEQGFKLTKRAGWQWQRTRMTDPERAARLWLAVAVATLWVVQVGGAADDTIPEGTMPDLAPALALQRRQRSATRPRMVSIFRRGVFHILVALLTQQPLPFGTLRPEPWPTIRGPVQLPLPGLEHAA
ncbi:MAG: hypothetical protein LC769_04675 [Chloroflexi bacterium]|nr:hypothetical protein [Chloroflexota bacterium]